MCVCEREREREREREQMGKGGMSHGSAGEAKDGEEENMAAWLLGINTLKIQPFKLPPLGISLFLINQTFLFFESV